MRLLTLTLIAALFWACSSDDDETAVATPHSPLWVEGFPQVAYGATSVDLLLKTQTSAEAYYILSDRPLDYTDQELKSKAEYPDTSAIKYSGKIELNSGSEWKTTVPLLEEGSDYFAYFVLRNRSGNLFSPVESSEFKTHYRQDTATFQSAVENRLVTYLVYRPETVLKYPATLSPVCFSLGDKNSIANDLQPVNIIRDGSPAEYIYLRNDVPMIVISLQSITADWNLSLIEEGIDYALATFPIDEDRIYLTGYGEGAVASWNYAITHSQQIAAIVPVSGRGDTFNACNLTNVNVWAFHNETDDIIPSINTKKMVNAIEKCSPQKELSEIYFPDAGHNCWKRVYNDSHPDWSKTPGIEKPGIYTWMLSKSRL
jgi:hypothetical protein